MIIINRPHYSNFFSLPPPPFQQLSARALRSARIRRTPPPTRVKFGPRQRPRLGAAANLACFRLLHPSSAATYSLWGGTAVSRVPSIHLSGPQTFHPSHKHKHTGRLSKPSLRLYSDQDSRRMVLRVFSHSASHLFCLLFFFFWSGESGGDIFLHQFAGNTTTSMYFHFHFFFLNNKPHNGGWNHSGTS